jgi:hypothetical protein
MLSDAIPLATEMIAPPDWGMLIDRLPFEWIESALAHTDKASIRRRRLPAEQVVWLVIALALYRHRSVRQVISELDLALPGMGEQLLTPSAVTQARQRLGPKPMQWLFDASAKTWMTQDAEQRKWRGLTLLAMDGTTLRLADSPANRAFFGGGSYANDSVASYPQTRGVTLCMLATQLVIAAQFEPFSTGELSMARQLLPRIPDHSLTVLDRGFWSSDMLMSLAGNGEQRHYLIPAKSNTKWTLIEGDELDGVVEMATSDQARKRNPNLARRWRARAVRITGENGKTRYLITSLFDKHRFPPAELDACFAHRWRIETSYRELKHTMMGMALTLRSRSVEGVQQEIWGALLAYNLVRVEMAKAALAVKCEPTVVSFILALAAIQHEMASAGVMLAPGRIPESLRRMRERMVIDLKVARPGRKFDRVIKAKAQRYPYVRTKISLT